MRVGKQDTALGKTVDSRSFDLCRAVATQVSIAEIVGQNDDDVRLLARKSGRCGFARCQRLYKFSPIQGAASSTR